ncbi:MAG TPA: Maf family nucleotide pyrophosphatase [Burkholderiaceae bacterium]|nr:Maf family nucleotide pyrophosphatase [Burkholderiaceae bacterium]
MPRQIVLASSSRYRQELLERLQLPFVIEVPAIDETPIPGETHRKTTERLSLLKANVAAQRQPGAIVIGADQLAELDGTTIGKPATPDAARQQLLSMRGRTVRFHCGIAVVDSASGRHIVDCIETDVTFRQLSEQTIDTYLRLDRPYDCAGSAKIEGLGICLVESVRSDDPTALIGLPLICLTSMLASLGVDVPLQGLG